MSIIDSQTVEQNNQTVGNYPQNIPSLRELVETPRVNFWPACAQFLRERDSLFLMPVLDGMEERVRDNLRALREQSPSQCCALFNDFAIVTERFSEVLTDVVTPLDSSVYEVRVPILPATVKNKELGSFMAFESHELAEVFLRVVDDHLESVACVSKDQGRGSVQRLGALYEVEGTHTPTAMTKNVWAIAL